MSSDNDGSIDADTRSCLDRFIAFGADASVERYVGLFHPDATLLDSGMARPLRGTAEIEAAITTTLRFMPDFSFALADVVTDGSTVFAVADNRATVAGSPTRWRAVYCFTITGTHISAGRRYYDQAALFAPLLAASAASGTASAVAGSAATGSPVGGPGAQGPADDSGRIDVESTRTPPPADASPRAELDPGRRAAAWNRGDAATLSAGLGPVEVIGPSLGGGAAGDPRTAARAVVALLDGLEVEPGAVVVDADRECSALEWRGRVTGAAGVSPFGLVELITPDRWELAFDTSVFDPDPAVIELRSHLLTGARR